MTNEKVYKGKGEFREPSKLEYERMEKIRKITEDVLHKSGNESLVEIGVDIDLDPPTFLVMILGSPQQQGELNIYIDIEDLFSIQSDSNGAKGED